MLIWGMLDNLSLDVRRATCCGLAVFIIGLLPLPAMGASTQAHTPYDVLVGQYFDARFIVAPTWATQMGRHEYDDRLENYTLASAAAEAKDLELFRQAFAAFPSEQLDAVQAADREMLLGSIDSQLQSLIELRPLENDPDSYSSGITASAFALIAREFAPPAVRLKALLARLAAAPGILDAARVNLKTPPHVLTEVALDQIAGNRTVFTEAIPTAFAGHISSADQGLLVAACLRVAKSLDAYRVFLENDVLPRSTGNFALGEAAYRRKLLAEELIDTPLPRLLAIGEADLARNQAAFQAAARQIDPKSTATDVLLKLGRKHPTPENLLVDAQNTLDEVRQFLVARDLVTIPTATPLRVVETPPFMRATTSAALDSPGPFETHASTAFFFITLPEPRATQAEREEFMAQFYAPGLSNLAAHEAYPGHYLQYLTAPKLPSITRKLVGASSLGEGWAHYCEQMVLDEGFHDGDPAYRLAQLQDALLRDARLIVGIKLHTAGMTMDEATSFFEKEAYQPAAVAKSEAWRGTSDPLYGYYTLGKLMILKLRADYKTAKGSAYSIRNFHNELLGQGGLPMPLIRQAMLGAKGDSLPLDEGNAHP
jgi:uncharacterized protein (DUF885 family)